MPVNFRYVGLLSIFKPMWQTSDDNNYVESVESLRLSCDPSENVIVLLIENEQ